MFGCTDTSCCKKTIQCAQDISVANKPRLDKNVGANSEGPLHSLSFNVECNGFPAGNSFAIAPRYFPFGGGKLG